MLYYGLVLLIVGLVAGVLNLSEGSSMVVQMSWILFLIGMVLVGIHLVRGRPAQVM
jgi:uncharacterized membrane protein YtjA (UPF0391 family)